MTAATTSALQVGSISSVSRTTVPKSASVSLGSSASLRGLRLRAAPAPRLRSTQPFAIRAEDGSGIVDSVKEGADQVAKNVQDGANKAGEVVSDAASNVKSGAQNVVETVKDKAGDLTGQAKSASKDLGSKAEDVKVHSRPYFYSRSVTIRLCCNCVSMN